MFTVYADKDIFEEIILYNDTRPAWYSILCNHSEVCLNMKDEELLNEQVPGTIIFEFIKANGGRTPIALKDFFDTITEEPETIIQKPRSVFLLNISEEEADILQKKYGVIVQCKETLDGSVLKGTYFKELPEGTKLELENKNGWQYLINFSIPPSNAMIISDDWLFKNEENSMIVGEQNLVDLIDSLLPAELGAVYQILIVSRDQDRSAKKCNQLAGNLMSKIKMLRTYLINVEIVFAETLHKRKLFLNYMSITCDKGFAMFALSDMKTIRSHNDFRYEKIFERNGSINGDTVYESDTILLEMILKNCNSIGEYIRNKCADPNKRIYGDCNPDKSINNRLLHHI